MERIWLCDNIYMKNMSNAADHVIDTIDVDSEVGSISSEKIINFFAKINQFLTWPIVYLLYNSIYKIDIRGRENLIKAQAPLIIIANHISYYDSFIFRLILGYNSNLLPLRFMAVKKFDNRWMNFLSAIGVIDFIYSLFGVFTVIPGLGINKNLERAQKIIQSGGNVVIYPEGKVNQNGNIGPFKDGAAVLCKRTQANVIPVVFKKFNSNGLRRRMVINVGSKIDIFDFDDQKRLTNKFRNVVVDLLDASQ